MVKGWHQEYERHAMARYGIKTGRKPSLTVKGINQKLHTERQGNKWVVANDKRTKTYFKTNNYSDAEDFISTWGNKKEPAMVVSSLDNVHNSIKYGDPKVANDMMNDVKRSIRAEKDLDFLNMDGRTMAYSILSDAQEELSRGNKKNALLFVKQAQDLYQGNYKKDGHEITFKDGQVAIF